MANVVNQNPNVVYSQNAPSVTAFQRPIIASRDVTTNDKAPLGTVWINKAIGNAFIAIQNVSGGTRWAGINNGTVVLTNVFATNTLAIGGDNGGGSVGYTTFTNAGDLTQGAGVMTILSTNGNAGNNSGFIKAYFGNTIIWLPFFDDIAP
jgi:hypothetical protein